MNNELHEACTEPRNCYCPCVVCEAARLVWSRPAIQLVDDGTLDTVLRCSGCGGERRYNFEGSEAPETELDMQEEYDQFVEDMSIEFATSHECEVR